MLANWVKPDGSGFFACGAAQTADPAATTFVERSGRLSRALASDGGRLGIECVSRAGNPPAGSASGGSPMRYAGCAGAHYGEFIGTYTITPPQAPFDAAAVRAAATRGCGELLLRFLRLPAGSSRADLRAAYVGPTSAGAWLGSDQAFTCYAMAARPVRGSMRGLGQRQLPRATAAGTG